MKIAINDHRKIFAVQEEFTNHFPNLKLEFHAKANTNSGAHSEKIVHQGSKTLGQCRTARETGEITITQNMSAAGLNQVFGDIYGLSTSVFKKTNNDWHEIASDDKHTLQEQNK